MKKVRLENNIVVEILPESTYELGIEHWYGKDFASNCADAPDDIAQGLKYNEVTKTFEKIIIEPENIEPSLTEKNRADIDYIAIMMGVDL